MAEISKTQRNSRVAVPAARERSGKSIPVQGTVVEHRKVNAGSISTRAGIAPCTAGTTPPGTGGSRTSDPEETISTYLRSSGIVYRAMNLLGDWKYEPARIICSGIPVDIVAIRRDRVLLVQVISSRAPVLDAVGLTRQYGTKIQNLRVMGTDAQFRKILLAYSQGAGWKYYDVLPGGLIPAWDLPELPTP
nr:hypothetical protein [uncultured Methanoregula sp.]